MESKKEIFEALYRYTKGLSVALGYRDLMTRLHSERVRELSGGIGLHYELDEHDAASLRIGSSFHDIGKVGIPDNILLKPASFDADEWEVMKRHSDIGAEIMLATGLQGSRHAAYVIRHHHEYYDGNGYPEGLSGDAIPICSRIISIADSYDAMSVTRPYQQARSHGEIMEVMRSESGGKLDPRLMDIFCNMIEHSPSRVE